jgi:hypothetical protein
MPYSKGKSDKSREKNVEQFIQEGKDPKQAVAMAYAIQRRAKKLKRD